MAKPNKPKRAVECPVGATPDETARQYGSLITKPEIDGFRVIKSDKEPGLTSKINTPRRLTPEQCRYLVKHKAEVIPALKVRELQSSEDTTGRYRKRFPDPSAGGLWWMSDLHSYIVYEGLASGA